MMATAAVIGLNAGKRILSSTFYSSEFTFIDHGSPQFSAPTSKSIIIARRSSHPNTSVPSERHSVSIKAVKEHTDTISPIATDDWSDLIEEEEDGDSDIKSSLEVFLLLQKSMLEKQWKLSFNQMSTATAPGETCRKTEVIRSGISARKRRTSTRTKSINQSSYVGIMEEGKQLRAAVSPELLQAKLTGYVRGTVSEDLLTHSEVVHLSKKIKAGLSLEDHRAKMKGKLGFEPSDKQLASSLRMSHSELRSKLTECSLAREKLAMSNIRLVMSIAQKYDNLGAEMADLIQGGLIGLVRGIEKFDSSKGFRISTYVYWWIRQGVSRTLAENSRTLRLPLHLHERLSSIRNAKIRLEERGITPSVDKLAKCLKISEKKVRNATEAVSKVLSLDREAFPSLNGLPSETLHSYIADNNVENIPWHGFEEWSLKDEVNKLLCATLGEREREIIRLYYGIDNECHTWEDISRQFGLSRERVRQVGLVALEKLKHAARKRKLEAMLVKH
ncbi:RNA polymerase sigma factor sigA [Asparagus officinalis]|uniref:RNA polymerase sigma factor sigA n=1 Tax=Asparagus officinalis TaxID=4686 RepID=UPI00098E70DA|nr:RNA polymerase sigma factor sigA [Asparagus officinalis]XP_020244787.1 RNA polymerase sigma factor sigA [Asparagus officinalis]